MLQQADAVAIAQLLAAFLIFALGVPLVTISATPQALRPLLYRRRAFRKIALLMGATIVTIIWLVEGGPVVVVPGSLAKWARPIDSTQAAHVVTGMLMTLYGLSWLVMYKADVHTKLVHAVRQSMRLSWSRGRPFADDDIQDLIALGALGVAGSEKRYVIEVLDEASRRVMNRPGYIGNELETLVHGLAEIVGSSANEGTVDNFIAAVTAIKGCWDRLDQKGLSDKADVRALVETAAVIGELALIHAVDAVCFKVLEAIPESSHLHFRVGRAALIRQNYRVAAGALSRLEALAERKRTVSRELVALVACFHAEGGYAADTVRDVFHRIHLTPAEVRQVAGDAMRGFYTTGDFVAAGTIAGYLRSLAQSANKEA